MKTFWPTEEQTVNGFRNLRAEIVADRLRSTFASFGVMHPAKIVRFHNVAQSKKAL